MQDRTLFHSRHGMRRSRSYTSSCLLRLGENGSVSSSTSSEEFVVELVPWKDPATNQGRLLPTTRDTVIMSSASCGPPRFALRARISFHAVRDPALPRGVCERRGQCASGRQSFSVVFTPLHAPASVILTTSAGDKESKLIPDVYCWGQRP